MTYSVVNRSYREAGSPWIWMCRTWELADGWERKKDGYLYHTGILEEDGILELYDAVIASSDIITKEDQTLVLETTIQAVQSEHLEVSSDGWGDTEIRQTLRSRNEVRSDA